MKIYTKTGDGGKTSLFSGERVPKSDARIEAYGDLDELNATLGALAAALPPALAAQLEILRSAQSALFVAGAQLATTPESAAASALATLGDEEARRFEGAIDALADALPPLASFILPGGHASAAWAHVARTVCRRAERRVIGRIGDLGHTPPAWTGILVFLNRLSDYLFVLARACNQATGTAEIEWRP